MATILTHKAFGFTLLIFSISFSTLTSALTNAEAAYIAKRQLLTLPENGDLPDNYEITVDPKLTFANDRLKSAYVGLHALKDVIYSDRTNFTANWEGPDVCKYNGVALRHLTIPKWTLWLVWTSTMQTSQLTFQLCGIVPKVFRRLKLMFEFDISNNRFVGQFPTVVLEWPEIKYLDLRFNQLEGELPPSLFLSSLDAIFLNNNKFNSTIPDTIGNSTVSVVTFAFNQFSGCLPSGIGNMCTVEELLFMNNNMSGCFPNEIGNLKNVTVLDVSNNGLVGPLPDSLSEQKTIEVLDVGYNQLIGLVPEKICSLPKLENFTLAYNYFSGEDQKCVPNPYEQLTSNDEGNCFPGRPNQKNTETCNPVVTRVIDCKYSCPGPKPVTPKPELPPTPKVEPPPVHWPPPPPVYSPPPPVHSPPPPDHSPPPPVHSPPPPIYSESSPPPVHSPPPFQSPPPPTSPPFLLPPKIGAQYMSPPPPISQDIKF
ncbi:hypothetical protein ACLB2K_011936 [Fragaria x ananassa]